VKLFQVTLKLLITNAVYSYGLMTVTCLCLYRSTKNPEDSMGGPYCCRPCPNPVSQPANPVHYLRPLPPGGNFKRHEPARGQWGTTKGVPATRGSASPQQGWPWRDIPEATQPVLDVPVLTGSFVVNVWLVQLTSHKDSPLYTSGLLCFEVQQLINKKAWHRIKMFVKKKQLTNCLPILW